MEREQLGETSPALSPPQLSPSQQQQQQPAPQVQQRPVEARADLLGGECDLEEEEDGPGPRCGRTLTAVGEERTPGYVGPRLILFGGATVLEGNSAASGALSSAGALASAGTRTLQAAQTSYCLLLVDSEIFSKLWDWSCFLDLVKQVANIDVSRDAGDADIVADVRWCGIQVLSVVLRSSCRPIADFCMETKEAFTCLLRWEEFCLDTSLEKAAWYVESPEQKKFSCPSTSIDFNLENCLQPSGHLALEIHSAL